MAFRTSRTAKRQGEARLWSEDELIWGVPRRPGYDEQDDPKGHAGLTQHAFEPGNDERAICGFEPPKRASGPTAKPRPQLAIPTTRLNPRCAKCARLIATSAVPIPPPALAAIEAAVAADLPLPAEPRPSAELPPPADLPPPTELLPPAELPPPTQARQHAQPRPSAELPPPTPPRPPAQQRPAAEPRPQAVPKTPVAPTRAARTSRPEPTPSESWEGTATFRAGDELVMVRPPSLPGLGVVASVVSGPSGTRVASVNINADGIAVITLSEPPRAPVTVAWFAVPAVDHVPPPEIRPEGPPAASPEGPPGAPPDPTV